MVTNHWYISSQRTDLDFFRYFCIVYLLEEGSNAFNKHDDKQLKKYFFNESNNSLSNLIFSKTLFSHKKSLIFIHFLVT